ncbi:MAG: hypothetical protein D6782_07650 [Alphaproteobacteria bacterium]|nr:MAG: hypothetical protein D6782_07650 [Alphaproteobacteria bacterium]
MSENRKTRTPEEDRLSIRRSVLIWVAGAMIGWIFAFVGIYSFLRFTDKAPGEQSRPALATDFDARALSEIQPAAGPADSQDTPAD